MVSLGFGLGRDELSGKIEEGILDRGIKGVGKDRVSGILAKVVFWIKKGVKFSGEDGKYDIKEVGLEC